MKNEIFKHGIKGIKKITGKYNTSKPLTEVKISCPCGLKWKWQAAFPDGIGREARALDWIQKCTANFRTHSTERLKKDWKFNLKPLQICSPFYMPPKTPLLKSGPDHSYTTLDPGRETIYSRVLNPSSKRTHTIPSPSVAIQSVGKRDPFRYQQHPTKPTRNKLPPHEA